jgi:hypothetical protein
MRIDYAPADTSPEAARVQVEIFRRMDASRRFELACEMSDTIRKVSADGVRSRHPDYTEEQVRLAVARITLGEDLFHRAFPGVDVRP